MIRSGISVNSAGASSQAMSENSRSQSGGTNPRAAVGAIVNELPTNVRAGFSSDDDSMLSSDSDEDSMSTSDSDSSSSNGILYIYEMLHVFRTGTLEDVQPHLDTGLDIDLHTPDGSALIHAAAENDDDSRILRKLLDAKANPNVQDNLQLMPLHIVAKKNVSRDIIKSLIDVTTNIDAPGLFENTPLHCAVSKDRADNAKLLIDGGANIDALNHFSTSPLMAAAISQSIDSVCLLIGKGANVTIKGSNGFSALDYAIMDNRREEEIRENKMDDATWDKKMNIAKCLLNAGAYFDKDTISRAPTEERRDQLKHLIFSAIAHKNNMLQHNQSSRLHQSGAILAKPTNTHPA